MGKWTVDTPFFVFDVESIGLHGKHFAIGGGVYRRGEAVPGTEFCYWWDFRKTSLDGFSLSKDKASGDYCGVSPQDLSWVLQYVVPTLVDFPSSLYSELILLFSKRLQAAQAEYPDLVIAGETVYPVETNFLGRVHQPYLPIIYPLVDITSVLLAVGFPAMETQPRASNELPSHNPLNDARQSYRLLYENYLLKQ